jgi:hypothetical protein
MPKNVRLFGRLFGLAVLMFASGIMAAWAQDSDKYGADYERMQKIQGIAQPDKRADQIIVFIKERPDMDAKIRDWIKGLFEDDLRKMKVREEFPALKELCERAIKIDPQMGQAYFYYGFALKNEKKDQEALNAFAKASVISTPSMQQAKAELDKLYKSTHRGSLEGEENLIANARKELNKLKK